MSTILAPVLAAASLTQAVVTPDASNGNFTFALFADGQGEACSANDISNTISLTTNSLPNGLGSFHNNGQRRNDIAYLFQNQHLYNANANYSRVWYAQANASKIEPGKAASWMFFTYALPGCQVANEK
ncbi:hypothetical protein A9K55_003526 [Cordyceps militaris]|uniref:Uncharacterized protein n=1 Tax=Cordyceps militaris TaxID=73501 RepID=A0A2H4S8C2_CORMI|nr:hypothetical protein A9K55_003526 [Cordyceps militaris]